MRRVLHLVVTGHFAGIERYVCTVARETSKRGWAVTVVGGDPDRMLAELGDGLVWRPGANVAEAVTSMARSGHQDIVHVHMTMAEAVALLTRPFHRGRIVASRHFAQSRGASRLGGIVAPWISRGIDHEVAVSDFVAARMERPPDSVIPSGVPDPGVLWREESHTVLVLQRLEVEKDTRTALLAWADSGLAVTGWRLRVVGDGAERSALEALVTDRRINGVDFAGFVPDVRPELADAALLLAPTPAEAFGLSVVEAMAAGVPVVVAASGAHLATALTSGGCGFPPGDSAGASELLKGLAASSSWRSSVSAALREAYLHKFTPSRHVERLISSAYLPNES